MNLDLKGRRAVVCGSTRGIGLACARQLASQGAEIILLARNERKLQSAVADLENPYGVEHKFIVADFAHPESVRSSVQEAAKNYDVHILINNTGGPPMAAALDSDVDDYRRAFNSHLICNQILAQTLVPGMKKAEYGRIINILSTSVREPIKNLGVSNTIRGAVSSWSKTISGELGPFGITVNNILPGSVQTERIEEIIQAQSEASGRSVEHTRKMHEESCSLKRFGTVDEIASTVGFLCSPSGSFITGVNLPVDGGKIKAI